MLEEKLKKSSSEGTKQSEKEIADLKKENSQMKEEIKKALQIHSANLKLKEKNDKLQEQLKKA